MTPGKNNGENLGSGEGWLVKRAVNGSFDVTEKHLCVGPAGEEE